MSGEKTDKAGEIWYQLLRNEKFLTEAERIRTNAQLNPKDMEKYQFKREFLFSKYGVIVTERLRNIFDEYVFDLRLKSLGNHLPIRLQTPSDEEIRVSKRALIKLWIYDGTSRDEILEYIKKNWKKIKALLRLQNTPKIKRTRITKNKK